MDFNTFLTSRIRLARYFFTLLLLPGVVLGGSGWWVSGEAGATFAEKETATHIASMPNAPAPPIYDNYRTDTREGGYLLGLSAGYQFALPHSPRTKTTTFLPAVRVGVGYEYVGSTEVKGQAIIYQEMPWYNYTYRVSSQILWLDGQLDLMRWGNFTPFIEAGIGPAFNKAQAYEESRISSAVPVRQSAEFASTTTASMAWRVGAGIYYTFPLAERTWALGLLARYSDLGETQTGPSSTYPTAGALSLPLVNTELLITLRYHF